MAAYIDLSDKQGHRADHGFACGAEFNVKLRRRINIPDFVREQLSQSAIDEIWWEEAGQSRDSLKEALSRRYKWIGELSFVGRGPGWLAIEDTGCRARNWDTIGKVVDQYLKSFVKSMENPRFWRDVKGVSSHEAASQHHAATHATSHATKKTGLLRNVSTPHEEKYQTWDGNVTVSNLKRGLWSVLPRGHAPFMVGSKREAFDQALGISSRHWGLPKEQAFPPRRAKK